MLGRKGRDGWLLGSAQRERQAAAQTFHGMVAGCAAGRPGPRWRQRKKWPIAAQTIDRMERPSGPVAGPDGPRRVRAVAPCRGAFHCHAVRRPLNSGGPCRTASPKGPGRKRSTFPPSAGRGSSRFTVAWSLVSLVMNRWRRGGDSGKINGCGFGPHGYDCNRRGRSPDGDRSARMATAGKVERRAAVHRTRRIVTNACTGAGKRPAEWIIHSPPGDA
jgi:hypothetical protein